MLGPPQLQGLLGRLPRLLPGLWLAGNEGTAKKRERINMGFIGTTIKIHSFIPS